MNPKTQTEISKEKKKLVAYGGVIGVSAGVALLVGTGAINMYITAIGVACIFAILFVNSLVLLKRLQANKPMLDVMRVSIPMRVWVVVLAPVIGLMTGGVLIEAFITHYTSNGVPPASFLLVPFGLLVLAIQIVLAALSLAKDSKVCTRRWKFIFLILLVNALAFVGVSVFAAVSVTL